MGVSGNLPGVVSIMINRERALSQAAINASVLTSQHLRDSLGTRTIRGGAVAVGGQFARFALQVMGTSVLAHLLAPDQFGLFSIGGAVMAFVGVLTEVNLTTAAVQRETLDQNTASAMMLLAFAMGCAAFLLSAATIPVAAWFFKDPRLSAVVLGLGACLPIYGFGALHGALLARNMRWLDLQIAQLSGLAIGTAVAIAAAKIFNAGYWALVIQSWATAITVTALQWVLCPWRPSRVHDWSGLKPVLRFGLHMTGSQFLNYFHQQLDNILIGWRWGPVELGFYSRAYNLLTTPLNFISGPLGSTMVPALSRLNQEPEKWREAYLDALAVVTFIGAALAGLLYGGVSPLVDILLGPHWQPVKLMFSCLILGMFATTPMNTAGWIYISIGRTNRMFQWAMIGVPVYIASFLIGLPYGAVGVALCYSISRYIAFFPAFLMAVRDTNITMTDVLAVIAVPTIAAAATGWVLSLAVSHLNPWVAVPVLVLGGLVYAAVIAITVLRLAVYERLRVRGLRMLVPIVARFNRAK